MAGRGNPKGVGNPKGRGRPKGSIGKVTAILKAAVMESFEELGGKEYLLQIAREDPKAYLQLLGKLLPSEIKADLTVNERPPLMRRKAVDVDGEEITDGEFTELKDKEVGQPRHH